MFGSTVLANLPFLLEGLLLTLWLTVLSALVSLVLGTIIAILRVQPFPLLRGFAAFYVEFFRNTPLLIQLFFFYHALPKAGLSLSGFECALWGLSIYTAAFVAETVRAGILAIHKGQTEAARSLGLSYLESMRYIILPQAFSVVIPPLGNLLIALLKNTSLASTIAVPEILYQAEVLDGRTFATLEIFTAVTVFYLILTLPSGYLVNMLEARLGRSTALIGRSLTEVSKPAFWARAGRGFGQALRFGLKPVGWALIGLASAIAWALRPLLVAIGAFSDWSQDKRNIKRGLQWGLYLTLAAALLYFWLVPYLYNVFTTEEGAQPWRPFTDGSTWLFLGNGVLVTVEVSAIAITLSLVIGIVFALGRLSKFPLIHWPSVAYIEILRALPVFLVIIMVHLWSSKAASGLGFSISEMWAVVLALTLYTISVNAEVIRAGITSIEKGQFEAARSLGLTYGQMMRFVILPQALQRMVPPLVSQFITLLKDTSLGYAIGLLELLRRGEIIYRGMFEGKMNNNPIQTFLVVAVIYFALCYALSLISLRYERSAARAR